MRRSPLPLVLLLALTGCNVPLAALQDVAKSAAKSSKATAEAGAKKADAKASADAKADQPKAGEGSASKTEPVVNEPAGPLGGLDFKAIAPENARYAGGVGGATPAAPMAAPMPSMAPPMGKGGGGPELPAGLTSGNMNGGYGYGYGYGMGYMGGEPTTLVSLTQTETAGSGGSYKIMMEAVVGPVIADWAPDAKLLGVNANTGTDGKLLAPSPLPSGVPAGCEPMYGGGPYESGWRLAYMSASRREALNFFVTPEKTLIIRARWAPMDLAQVPVEVDNDAALKALAAAIETQGAQSEEEKTGVDYFMGGSFASEPLNCFPQPTMPMPARDYPPGYEPGEFRTEVVYDVPDNARWNTNLQVILGKPVWELSFWAEDPAREAMMKKVGPNGEGMVYEDPGYNFNNNARGLVDAATGKVIRFSRPSKHYYPKPMPYPSPMPGYPMPMPTPMSSAPPPGPNDTPAPTTPPSPMPTASAPAP